MPEIVIDGHVVAKGRPRFVRATGHVYSPDRTMEAERAIRAAWNAIGVGGIKRPIPISLSVSAYLERPKLHYRTAKGHEHELKPGVPKRPTTKPDLDNLVKTVKDALNGLAWEDDSQVVQIHAGKFYADSSGWLIIVNEWSKCND